MSNDDKAVQEKQQVHLNTSLKFQRIIFLKIAFATFAYLIFQDRQVTHVLPFFDRGSCGIFIVVSEINLVLIRIKCL
jgi:hypothetical protein